jgi:hypothetical protein
VVQLASLAAPQIGAPALSRAGGHAAPSGGNDAHPMTTFLPLFIDRDRESGLTQADMYLGHVFPHYTRVEHRLGAQGAVASPPPVDGRLPGNNIGRRIAAAVGGPARRTTACLPSGGEVSPVGGDGRTA